MKFNIIKIVSLSLIMIFFCNYPVIAQEKIVTLATLDWEPYIGEKLENNGFISEIVHEAFKRKGYKVKNEFLPWARVIKMAEEGKVDGYYPEYFTEELKKNYIVSESYPCGPLGFAKIKDKNISYKNMEDLKPYKIGIVRGYVNTAEFDAATYLKKDEAVDDITNIKKLLAGRIDLIVIDKYVLSYQLKKELPDKLNQIEFIEPPLETKELFTCIGKKIQNGEELMKMFNEGLNEIKKDGTLKKIMQKHGF
ncbi:MAG: transporter substrate-binding domain-containing protein [Desulfobacterales bacterium]|nr:transporter substrate-binding domain-containing protein [Desulfobacterales bacterium]MBF0397887.1 transporter substrate-binding domain-containing protein [Desulfobacterales bacterium]